MLMLDYFPKFTAPSAHRARSKLQDAFLKYYRTNGKGNANAPDFVQRKKALAQKYNLSDHYNSRADVGELLAMLANVVPVSFWVLFYIFSSPSLLADLRTEVQNHLLQPNLHEDADSIKTERGYLDVPHIQTKCPLLVSTWKEVLRIATLTTTTNRCVLADTYIGSQILLKKGGIVQIPTGAFHSDQNVWGSNVNEFDPRRFLPSKQAHRSAAFRPFGGGSTMCPGRYLAVTEILGFVSAVILGFEISPVEGEWKLPKKDSRPFPGTVKPASDIKVVIRRRVGFEKSVWSFKRFDV
jgi:cytochrome P450